MTELTSLPTATGSQLRGLRTHAFSGTAPYADYQVGLDDLMAASAVGYYPEATAQVPKGLNLDTNTALVPGSGGTDGIFTATWSGGNFTVNPRARFKVRNGRVDWFVVDGPGLCVNASPSAPTVSLSASTGLTGVTIPLAIDVLVPSGETWWGDHASDGDLWQLYRNNAGTAAALSGRTQPKGVYAVTEAVDDGIAAVSAQETASVAAVNAVGAGIVAEATAAAATVGFPGIAGERGLDVLAGNTNAQGVKQIAAALDLATGRVGGLIDGATAVALAKPALVLGTNWSARQIIDSTFNAQIRCESRVIGTPGLVTTSGNNVDPIMSGDTVIWRNASAAGPEAQMVYAPASGIEPVTGGLIKAAQPRARWFCEGDSLTAGSGSSLIGTNALEADATGTGFGSYPSRLCNLLGGPNNVRVFNDGYSGHTAQHMLSRMDHDDYPILINVTGASVPGTGTVSVTSISPYAGLAGHGPLAASSGKSLTGWCEIAGVRTRVILRATVSGGVTTYTLEKAVAGGAALSWPNQTRFYRDMADKDDRIIVWWAGRNFETVAQLDADDARVSGAIRSLSKRMLAIGIPVKRDGTEDAGMTYRTNNIDPANANKLARWGSVAAGGAYIDINAFFQRLSPFGDGAGAGTFNAFGGTNADGSFKLEGTTFPSYIANSDGTMTYPNAFVIMGLSPTAQDLTDMAAGRNPDTFMGTDNLHISDDGYEALARLLVLINDAKGWSL